MDLLRNYVLINQHALMANALNENVSVDASYAIDIVNAAFLKRYIIRR